MYVETQDEELFKRFWEDERSNTPRWYQNSVNAFRCTWEDYLGFCKQCWKVYKLGDGLLFVEKVNDNANIHFSLLRGKKVTDEMMEDFLKIRDELLTECQCIFGWCFEKNKRLQRILEYVGLQFRGFEMLHGHSHGKVLRYLCFSIHRETVTL